MRWPGLDSRGRRCRGTACALTLAAAVLAAACGGPGGQAMVSAEPPSGWQERLASWRADRDDSFRDEATTPLLPEDLATFDGLDYWPADPAYRLVGPIHRYPQPERFDIATTSGRMRPCERYGWVTFDLDGRRYTLQVYRLLDAPEGAGDGLFLPFTDRTSGKETYPAGRYIDLDGQPGGLYVLDFNRAYNPLCAYGAPERYVCPVTPPENRLERRIEAGERGYKK